VSRSTSPDLARALKAAADAQRATADALDVLAGVVAQGPPEAVQEAATGSEEVLLDVRRAAARIGMSTSWLYRAIGRGRLPVVRIGSRVHLRIADLDSFIKGCRSAQDPEKKAQDVRDEGSRHGPVVL